MVALRPVEDGDFVALLAGRAPHGLHMAAGGVASPAVLDILRKAASEVRAEFEPAGWLIVADGELVGLCSLKTPPGPARSLEIGYGIAPGRRRQGFATQAVAAVLGWARADPRIDAITAETSIDNDGSQRILQGNGFMRSGERLDEEDGALYTWRIATP